MSVANISGLRRPSALSASARIVTRRVAGLITSPMVVRVAVKTSSGQAVTRNSTGSGADSRWRSPSGTSAVIQTRDRSETTISGVPRVTASPGQASRSMTAPANGARTGTCSFSRGSASGRGVRP